MRGICRIVRDGEVVGVLVRGPDGADFEMRIEEYVTQELRPAPENLPVCGARAAGTGE